jgi:hypothetical protein
MLNLTQHPITVQSGDRSVTFQPSGTVARVETVESVEFQIDFDGVIIPVVSRRFGDVQGLPVYGSPCIVSSLVLGAVPGRPDTFAPDTGSTAIRNDKGQVIAVTRLVAA